MRGCFQNTYTGYGVEQFIFFKNHIMQLSEGQVNKTFILQIAMKNRQKIC